MKSFNDFELKCFVPNTNLNETKKIDEEVESLKENCRNYDYENKTCLTCERGFYKNKVQNKFLTEESKLFDKDLLYASKESEIYKIKNEEKCVPCKTENCDLCYKNTGKCYSCRIGYY